MSEKIGKISLVDLAKTVGVAPEAARALGRNALLSQIGELAGHTTTRCDADAHQSDQYTGDLERDFGDMLQRIE